MDTSRTRRRLVVAFVPSLLLCLSFLAGCNRAAPAIDLVQVPQLAGMTPQEAQERLGESGLEAGGIREVYSDAVNAGRIVSSSPSSGEEAAKGSAVALTVSKGPEMVSVPALLGSTEADALAALQALGLQAEVQRVYNESMGAGLVCSTEPAPKTAIMRGSKVAVTVSLGSAYVACGTCGGDGTAVSVVTCPECGGTGTCDT